MNIKNPSDRHAFYRKVVKQIGPYIVDRKFSVMEDIANPRQVAYTILDADKAITPIFINPGFPLLMDAMENDEGRWRMLVTGLLMHEMLHSAYTDPEAIMSYYETERRKKKDSCPDLLMDLNNLIEDLTIEARAVNDLNEKELGTLNRKSLVFWRAGAPILDQDGVPDQVVRALNMFELFGPLVPGSKLSKEASDLYEKHLPDFFNAIWMEPKERAEVVYQIYQALIPFVLEGKYAAQTPEGARGQTNYVKNLSPEDAKNIANAQKNRSQAIQKMQQPSQQGQQNQQSQQGQSSQQGGQSQQGQPSQQGEQSQQGDSSQHDQQNEMAQLSKQGGQSQQSQSSQQGSNGSQADQDGQMGKDASGSSNGSEAQKSGQQGTDSGNASQSGDSADESGSDGTSAQSAGGKGRRKDSSSSESGNGSDDHDSGSESDSGAESESSKGNANAKKDPGKKKSGKNHKADEQDGEGSEEEDSESDSESGSNAEDSEDGKSGKSGKGSESASGEDGESSDSSDGTGDDAKGSEDGTGSDGSENASAESEDGKAEKGTETGDDASGDVENGSTGDDGASGNSAQGSSQSDASFQDPMGNLLHKMMEDIEDEETVDITVSEDEVSQETSIQTGRDQMKSDRSLEQNVEMDGRRISFNNRKVVGASSGTSNLYERYKKQDSGTINAFARKLEEMISIDEEDTFGKNGSLNLERLRTKGNTSVNIFQKHAENAKTDARVLFLVDASGSMMSAASGRFGRSRLDAVKEALLVLTESMIKAGIPVKVISFEESSGINLNHYVNYSSSRKEREALMSMKAGGGTPLAESFAYAMKDVQKTRAQHRLLITITDGIPNDFQKAMTVINEAKRTNVKIIGIGINSDARPVAAIFKESFVMLDDLNLFIKNLTNIIEKEVRSW